MPRDGRYTGNAGAVTSMGSGMGGILVSAQSHIMSFTPAKKIVSPQDGLHKNLVAIVSKHQRHTFQRPIASHTQKAFEQARAYWQALGCPPLIFDSACGTAESSRYLAQQYPRHLVIGIDQSQARLSHSENNILPENCLLLRADCTDFWRLAGKHQWYCEKHYLLYPNPYPKPAQFQRRWHGHPAFPDLLAVSPVIELRTNWSIYAEEFYMGARQYERQVLLEEYSLGEAAAITAFERKYNASGHELWRVAVT